jgi:hypothetical protein
MGVNPMTPTTAYKRLNNLLWRGRLPAATIFLVADTVMPGCFGVTLFDEDFDRPVIILNSSLKRWGKTLVHECLHVAEPELPHGKLFDSLVASYWRFAKKEIKAFRGPYGA